MDTSEEYTMMCELAKEIQKQWDYSVFDFWKFKNPELPPPLISGYDCFEKEGKIWLPQQDQLQKMFNYDWHSVFCNGLISKFHESQYYIQFKTMEELWLAYVMKEKYNKIWYDDNWVKAGD